MLPNDVISLREILNDASDASSRFLWGFRGTVCLRDLARGSCLDGDLSEFSGRSVFLAIRDQFVAALALIELDGAARRLILCPPDLTSEQLSSVIAGADVDAIVTDGLLPQSNVSNCVRVAYRSNSIRGTAVPERCSTEWVLLTSGTTSTPKLVLHSLCSLIAAIKASDNPASPITWGTFYDIRRYGGLQIFLRTILGHASMVLSGMEEPLGDYLTRLGGHGVTHLLGTPTHWRRVLMSSCGS